MKLDHVTITGADDSIEPKALSNLSAEFPFVEWGILFSGKRQGSVRFPSMGWCSYLLEESRKSPMRLSAHVCGYMVRDLICAGQFTFQTSYPDYCPMFQRIQINTHAAPHRPCFGFVDLVVAQTDKQFVMQYDGENDGWIRTLLGLTKNTVPLFDISHGAGVVPVSWPKPIGDYCGYAGGLGPDTLEAQLDLISEAAGENRVWIDMETKVRSDGDRLFGLGKVRCCLEIAKPFISA